jgi:hypothetical protein
MKTPNVHTVSKERIRQREYRNELNQKPIVADFDHSQLKCEQFKGGSPDLHSERMELHFVFHKDLIERVPEPNKAGAIRRAA